MAKTAEPSKRDEWAARVRRWEKSGLSVGEFAKTEGVKPSTLAWWRWKLGGGPMPERPDLALSFVALEPSVPTVETGCFEVLFTNGRVLRIPDRFNELALTRLIAIVEGSA